jgi:hypothetical protein
MISFTLTRSLQIGDLFEQRYQNKWIRGRVTGRPYATTFTYLSEGEPFPRVKHGGEIISGVNLTFETTYDKDDKLIKVAFSNSAKINFDAMGASFKNIEGFWLIRFIVMHARHALSPNLEDDWTYPALQTNENGNPGADYFRWRFKVVCDAFR